MRSLRLQAHSPARRIVTSVMVAVFVSASSATGAYATPPDTGVPNEDLGVEVTNEVGDISVVGAAPGQPLTDDKPGNPPAAALSAVEELADGLGVAEPSRELAATSADPMDDGGTTVRFSQSVDGIPVFGSGIAVRLDADNAALSIASSTVATDRLDAVPTTPTIDAATASHTALSATARDLPTDEAIVSTPQTTIYDPHLIGGDPNAATMNAPRLAWSVLVTNANDSYRQRILIDAIDGGVLLNFSEIPDALVRNVCDYNNTGTPATCRDEGDAAPAGNTELNRAYEFIGQSYDYLNTQFGRDGYDDAGSPIEAHTRVCPAFSTMCPYRNAYWYGSGIVFGDGFASADDIVGHEFTHGVTENEAGLMYYAESGAINESMSDVFGELIDLSYDTLGSDTATNRWLIGEDSGTIRSMKNPPLYGDPDRVLSPFYHLASSDNYGVHINSGVNNKAAFLMVEGGTFNGYVIAPLGEVKTAAIYYEALTALLTPGSDYLDLYGILPQACNNLVGTKGIVASDCATVQSIVDATEMNQAPSTRRLADSTCSQGTRTILFSDNAESGLGKWITASGTAGWSSSVRASQSGDRSLYGPSLAGIDQNGPGYSSWLRTRYRVTVPTAGDSFLWFDHSFNLEEAWDGGVVQYSIDGSTWDDVGSQADANGYTGLLDASANPLTGQRAFTGQSRGFQQTRIPLDTVAGESVYLRFMIGSDATVAEDGWFVDDVVVYNCATTTSTTTTTTTTTTSTTTTTTTTTAPTTTTTTTTAPPTTSGFSSGFVPVTPRRIIDTRNSNGLVYARGERSAGSVLRFNARDLGIYANGHTPTALNLNITNVLNSAPGHITAYPCGNTPNTSTVNADSVGQVIANTATIPISSSGEICIYTHAKTHLLVDVLGYQTSTKGATAPSRYQPLNPRRLIDTRSNAGLIALRGRRSAGSTFTIDTANLGLFGSNAKPTALDLNITSVNNASAGHVTAYPCGTRPTTSTVNADRPGQIIANTATIPVSSSGKVCLYTHAATDVLVDITGYYATEQASTLSQYQSLTPRRLVDTRNNNGLIKLVGQRSAGTTLRINPTKLGLQSTGRTPTAFDLNITNVLNTAPGHITVYPCGTRPKTSTLNADRAGQVIANTATIPISSTGEICIYTHATTHLLIDVTGYHYK